MLEGLNNKFCVSIILVIFLFVNYYQTAAADIPAPKQLVATRTDTPPVIDGKLDDACWQKAAQATNFSTFFNPNQLKKEQTIGRVCYDENNLYLAVECFVDEMAKFRKRQAETNGKFDYAKAGVIEVFIDTNHDQKKYDHYLLHSNGSSSVSLPKDDLFKILNEDYIYRKAVLTETGFIIEAAFPFAMLHFQPGTSKIWGFNLNRVHDLYDEQSPNAEGFFSSWNSTQGKSFQSPQYFGELLIDKDFSRYFWKVSFSREPQAGDSSVQLKIINETGRDFDGKLVFSITGSSGKPFLKEKPLSFKTGEDKVVGFDHSLSAADMEAKFEIKIIDSTGKVCYMGGTQKEDLTPGDSWKAPKPTKAQKKAGFIAFARPYCQPVLYRSVPKSNEVVSELSISACRGEFEPTTLEIYPLRDIKVLKVSVSDLAGTDGATISKTSITVRRVIPQSDWKNPKAFEAKEHLLRTFDSLTLAKSQTQRLWFTLKVDEKAATGKYRGTVSLNSDGVISEIPLVVQVLSFELSPTDDMGYFMYYPGVKNFKPTCNAEFFTKTVRDMLDHGMTTFTIYNNMQVEGDLNYNIDNHVADNLGVTYAQMIDILRKEGLGKDIPLMDVAARNYEPELIVAMDKVFRERKWPEVLFYINDEVDLPDRIAEAKCILEAIKKLTPDIKTTTALGLGGAEALGHLYDVWIGCSTPEMIQKCLSMGKHPWTYSCRADFEVCPAFERSFFGRFAWKIGLKGVSLWSYAENNAFSDRFGRKYDYSQMTFTPEWKHEYGHVYFEDGQIIPTVTWEAVREGIDDYRYMLTLKKVAQAAIDSKDARKSAAGEKGMELLNTITEQINPEYNADDKKFGRNWQIFGDMDGERAKIINAIIDIQKVSKN